MALDTEDKDFQRYCEKWLKVRSVNAGRDELIANVTTIPRPQYTQYGNKQNGSPEYYELATKKNKINYQRAIEYWSRGVLLPALSGTYKALCGMIWSKEPESFFEPRLSYLEENATAAGEGIREVAQKITSELMLAGRYAMLVDMPEVVSATIADNERPENAPYWLKYKAEDIFYTRKNGKSKGLDEVRIYETHSAEKADYEWEDLQYIRRLVIIDGVYHNQLFDEKRELVKDFEPVMNGSKMSYIPIVFFGSEDNTCDYSEPPLCSIAQLNIGHFILDCDNRENLHFHGQGTTNVYVADTGEFEEDNPAGLDVGAKGINIFNVADRVEILQIQATGAIPADMLRDEQRLIMSGAQMVTENSANMTLGAKRIDANANTSALKQMSYNITDGLATLIKYTAGFLGVEVGNTMYKLNTDFITDDLTPEMINTHFALVQGGVLPSITLNETARKAKLTDLDDEEIEKALNDQNLLVGGITEQAAQAQALIDADEE